MGDSLGYDSVQDLVDKMDYEGGAAEMVYHSGLGGPDTVEPLNELLPGLGDAFSELYRGVRAVDDLLADYA